LEKGTRGRERRGEVGWRRGGMYSTEYRGAREGEEQRRGKSQEGGGRREGVPIRSPKGDQ
jgi:hypothetical protein